MAKTLQEQENELIAEVEAKLRDGLTVQETPGMIRRLINTIRMRHSLVDQIKARTPADIIKEAWEHIERDKHSAYSDMLVIGTYAFRISDAKILMRSWEEHDKALRFIMGEAGRAYMHSMSPFAMDVEMRNVAQNFQSISNCAQEALNYAARGAQ